MFIFCKGGDITNDGRSILASFCFSKRRKKRTGSTVSLVVRNFFSVFFYLFTGRSLLFPNACFVLLCYLDVENALSIAKLQRTIFDSHCVGTIITLLLL